MSAHPRAGFFVTGTDTGVGKTLAACALIRAFRERGIDTGAMKPVETGVGAEGPLDAIALRAAAGGADPLEDVCPQQFALPAAPSVAARAEARAVDLDAIRDAFKRISQRHQLMVVEGAGGLLVPLSAGVVMADLAAVFELPLLIVARAALGTINHTLLTLEAAASRGLQVSGVIVSHVGGGLSDADEANLSSLRDALGKRLIGEIPPLAAHRQAPPGVIDLDRLLATITQP